MDHRWDEMLQAEHRRRVEQSRYDQRAVGGDRDVDRRDQLALAQRRVNKSPWEIGASHWDQRDLYTQNNHVDESGYARGPNLHPEVGSYAYPRYPHARVAPSPRPFGPTLYEREAWPWLNYQRFEQGPKGWRRADDSVREDVCEALADDAALDCRDIEVTVESGEVTLAGTVPDRHSKRLAERIAERIRGVEDVHNRLTIRTDDDDLAFTAPIASY